MPTQIDRTRRGWPWQIGAEGEVLKVVSGWPTWDVSGGGSSVQKFTDLARTFNIWWTANPGTVNTQTHGAGNFTARGTVVSPALSEGTIYTSTPKVEHVETVASSTNAVGLRSGAPFIFSGVQRGGGFRVAGVFGMASGATNSSHRLFFGLNNLNLNPTDVNPSTQTNIIGFGYDSADAQFQFMTNDGSGTATKTPLGSSFPKPSTNGNELYLAEIERLDGAASVSWSLTNLETGDVAAGSASSDLPASNTAMLFYSYASVGGVSSVIGLALSRVYITTIY